MLAAGEAVLELGLVEGDKHDDDHGVDGLRCQSIGSACDGTVVGKGRTYDNGRDAGFVVERRCAPRAVVVVGHHVTDDVVGEELHLDQWSQMAVYLSLRCGHRGIPKQDSRSSPTPQAAP